MKKYIAALAAFVLTISLCASCSRGADGYDAYKEIYKRYSNIENFYAEAEITVENPRTETVYHVRQSYTAPDSYTLVIDSPEALAGSGYVFRGGKATLKSGFGKDESVSAAAPETRNCFFVNDFFAEYFGSEESAAKSSGGFSGGETALDCYISSGTSDKFRQTLTVDNKTFLPLKLTTYGADGKPRVTVKFIEFKLNSDDGEIKF